MTVPVADRGPQLNGVTIVFLVLGTLTTILRCYCRAVVVKNFGPDDWLAVIAWALFVLFSAFSINSVYHGVGKHASTLPPAEIVDGLKWRWACEVTYVVANMTVKTCIAIFLIRIAVNRVHKIIIWSIVAIIEFYSIAYLFVFIFQCRPSAYFWTQHTGAKGSCLGPKELADLTYVYSGISCVTDWALGIVPVFIVWKVQMNSRTKSVVAILLALGALASTATIIRIPYVKNSINQTDFLYDTVDVAIWSDVETGIGLVASACATLRPLFRTSLCREHFIGNTTSNRSSHPFPKSGPSSGYIRQTNSGIGDTKEFGLRSDIGENRGVTTVIAHGRATELDLESGRGGKGAWSNSKSQLTGGSDDEEERQAWKKGIRKTTVSTQIAS